MQDNILPPFALEQRLHRLSTYDDALLNITPHIRVKIFDVLRSGNQYFCSDFFPIATEEDSLEERLFFCYTSMRSLTVTFSLFFNDSYRLNREISIQKNLLEQCGDARMNGVFKIIKRVFLGLAIMIGLSFFLIYDAFLKPVPITDSTQSFRILPGENFRTVLQTLETQHITKRYYHAFYAALFRLSKLDRHIHSGEYCVEKFHTTLDTFQKICQGRIHYRRICIPEGLTNYQIMLLLAQDMEDIEPFFTDQTALMPDTYLYTADESSGAIIARMEENLRTFLMDAWENRDTTIPLLSPYEALILASIIEKETNLETEKPRVAAVFMNRIQRNMKLQADPTIVFAVSHQTGILPRSLTKSDLQIDSPYNTYRLTGLPPTPICNPSKTSILAALHPENSNYLYFVKSSHHREHHFSHTYEEHKRYIDQYMLERH